MKLGISYIAFEGEELLPFVLKPIRKELFYVSVVYQTISFFGNSVHEEFVSNLRNIKEIDELILCQPENNLTPKENELKMRKIGLDSSRKAGCTHHIAADVDEFYEQNQLIYAKNQMDGWNCSVTGIENYFKNPRWKIVPNQKQMCSFIQKVDLELEKNCKFPYKIEPTRRCFPYDKCREFSNKEIVMHHMSFVRKNIRRKVINSQNNVCYNVEKFIRNFDKYELGDILQVPPDMMNRRTIFVDNIFNIEESEWQHLQ